MILPISASQVARLQAKPPVPSSPLLYIACNCRGSSRSLETTVFHSILSHSWGWSPSQFLNSKLLRKRNLIGPGHLFKPFTQTQVTGQSGDSLPLCKVLIPIQITTLCIFVMRSLGITNLFLDFQLFIAM
jgi:hypothetical protein